MSDQPDFEARLAALEGGETNTAEKKRPSVLLATVGIGAILSLGGLAYLGAQPQEEVALPTAQPDEFQPAGDGFGEIQPFVPPAPPEPEIRVVEQQVEPNAELLAQIAKLQAQIEAIQNAPEPVVEDNSAAAEAIEALTAQIAALQESSEAAQSQFTEELAARDRQLRMLRSDLELAQLQTPAEPILNGPSDEEQRRLAELERRRQQELAFQQARIESPMIAFGNSSNSGAGGDELASRTFGEVTDFVLNGAAPSQVTQSEIIANPSSTVVQGTMIQAVTETAMDSSLPGQIRAVISEDVHAFDGSRVLIPRGSRLIGRYRSGLDIAQKRVTIAWDRIIMPNNQSVEISSFGGDELGRSGVTGFVDTRFAERFGSAALISLISAAPSAASANVTDDTAAEVLEDIGDDLANATDSVIGEYLSLGPVIYVKQGSRITVMVDRDLEIF